jgi:hypothetical protein
MFQRFSLVALSVFIVGLALAGLVAGREPQAPDKILTVQVVADKDGFQGGPVSVPLQIPETWAKDITSTPVVRFGEKSLPGQLTQPGLLTEAIAAEKDKVRRDLHFIGPPMKAGETAAITVDLTGKVALKSSTLKWFDKSKEYAEVSLFDPEGKKVRPLMRYICRPFDTSSRAEQDKTTKVFHHLYDPEGKRFVTNGGQTDPGADKQKLLYPHHRGLMFGYRDVTLSDGVKYNVWESNKDGHILHEKYLLVEQGPVLARHRVLISWWADKKQDFAHEQRELTIYNTDGPTLVDFATKLEATGNKVKLSGDAQHAGFHFRASQDVATSTAKQTYYLRPDGKGDLGATRNWDPKKPNEGPIDLPWDALCFLLGNQRYTTGYFNSPSNPKASRFSERDYGRFGCYFEWELTKDHPLAATYRVSLQKGETDGAAMQSLYSAYAKPPQVTLK